MPEPRKKDGGFVRGGLLHMAGLKVQEQSFLPQEVALGLSLLVTLA